MDNEEFKKYATRDRGIASTTLSRFQSATNAYINPMIIEERKLNVATMDVFSRLMMDRIIFLGVPIDDDVANIIQANCSSWHPPIRGLTSLCTSTPPADKSPPGWRSTTPCT